ncbi:MAG TPA: Rossmann-like and DUF2520 domain-containing protein [Candidatus Dormibacteraeota bacterium]|nr:Rossmann-like and DUF2520 domain-containing protein [Candidatus Dormibacteraeota bacterium]
MPETLSIIGAGRVGRTLGRQLHQLGWRIGALTGRSITSARAAARAIGAGQPADRITPQVLASKIVLIATPDSAIAPVAKTLAEMGGNEWRGKIVLHTSGATGSAVLEPLAKLGAATGSMHPMQTFSDQSAPALAGRVFGIEGSAAALQTARKIIRQLGGVAVSLTGTNKAAYHAAGSLACGHVLALVETATRLLMAQGFTRRQAVRALLPLTRQTLDNIERVGPRAAWTGPLTRGDFSTVQKHLEALADFPPEYLKAYEAVSRLAVSVLATNPAANLQRLDRVFRPAAKPHNKAARKTGKKGRSK